MKLIAALVGFMLGMLAESFTGGLSRLREMLKAEDGPAPPPPPKAKRMDGPSPPPPPKQ